MDALRKALNIPDTRLINNQAQRCYLHVKESNKSIPELEPLIATDAFYSYAYAYNILKGRFPLGEVKIASDPFYAFNYAVNVLKNRFPLGEQAITTNTWFSYLYSRFLNEQPKQFS